MKQIAALLTVHNRKDKTLKCLGSLFSQEIPEGYALDVYLTDDGCTDGTPEAVRELYPQVRIIDGDGNLFWNRGMWTAWKVASAEKDYDHYLWLNDDTDLYPGCMTSLLDVSSKASDKAIAIGATVDPETKALTYGGRVDGNIAPVDGSTHEVDCFNGNIVLVPSYAFGALGNLDFFYTHSKGDFDYAIRARKAGIQMLQAGTALGECAGHERVDKWCDPEIPLRERWTLMKQPCGMPPKEVFHLEKQISLPMAAFHFFTVHLRCLFPGLWVKRQCGMSNN